MLSKATIARQMSTLNRLYFINNIPVSPAKTNHCTHTHTVTLASTRTLDTHPSCGFGLVVWWFGGLLTPLSSQEKKKEEMCLALLMGIVINTDPKPKFLLVRAHSSGKPIWSWSGVGSQKQHHPRNKEKHDSSFVMVYSLVLPEGAREAIPQHHKV